MKKKLTALMLVLMLIFTSCSTNPVLCEHVDINDDDICEFCGKSIRGDENCEHKDENDD